tara:strand:+ start:25 stop:774 length:750 start_codon:yes stop_codon:yes gene_type:complete
MRNIQMLDIKGKIVNQSEVTNLLNEFLCEMHEEKDKFKADLNDAKKKSIAISFQEKIFRILDYIYTNFPTDRNLLNDHFPRPTTSDTELQYLARIKKFKKTKKVLTQPKKVLTFLKLFYRINTKYNKAISQIKGKVKHETPNEFGEQAKTSLSYKAISNAQSPIEQNSDGSILIGGFIHAHAGATVNMHGTTIQTPDGITHIEHLKYSGTAFEADKIVFNCGSKIKFEDWANDCISICRETIEMYSIQK